MHPRDKDVPPAIRRMPRPRGLRGSAAPARRWLARTLLLAAGLLAAQAAWLPAKAALAQVLLATSWQQSLADGKAHRPWPWADTHAVARLSSPRLGVSQVVLAGDSGRSLAFGPGWAESSAAPGAAGTVVISGHRDTHFRWLKDLRDGDVVQLESRDGPRRYQVAGTRVADARSERIAASGRDQLLLVTCWPFEATAPRGPLRYLVTLRPLPRASSR
ncbi:class GN sortase [Arenimonas aestuarii]